MYQAENLDSWSQVVRLIVSTEIIFKQKSKSSVRIFALKIIYYKHRRLMNDELGRWWFLCGKFMEIERPSEIIKVLSICLRLKKLASNPINENKNYG